MRRAAGVFFLAVFALLGECHTSGSASSKHDVRAREASPDVCAVSGHSSNCTTPQDQSPKHLFTTQFEPGAIVSDACASYSTLDKLNDLLFPFVHNATQSTDFFSFYRLNLNHKTCPFWDEGGMCKYETCAVTTVDKEEDLPLAWRAQELSKIEGPKAQHPGRKQQAERQAQKPLQGELGDDVGESCVVEYDDECDERDYCVPEDESASAKGDYVSLLDNPERFTGYSGQSTKQVWSAIYRENCFSKPSKEPMTMYNPRSPFGIENPLQVQAALDLRSVMKEHGTQQGLQHATASGGTPGFLDGLEFEDSCIEKRVFHRVISGMHASISTHLCWDYLNRTTGQWTPNLECFKERLHGHPERISNLYFNYALLLRAVAKLRNKIKGYSFCAADPFQDRDTKQIVVSLVDAIPNRGKDAFDESVMFKGPDALGLKEDFKNRFRNISRIMDCVGCDRCRLWGKVQTHGYGTALKVLFEYDEKNPENDPYLKRTELVALVNTLDKVSHSLQAIRKFEAMINHGTGATPKLAENPEAAHPSVEVSSVVPSPSPVSESPAAKEDDGYPDFKRKPRGNMTIAEEFWDEFDLVWRAYKYVLTSWVNIPRKL